MGFSTLSTDGLFGGRGVAASPDPGDVLAQVAPSGPEEEHAAQHDEQRHRAGQGGTATNPR